MASLLPHPWYGYLPASLFRQGMGISGNTIPCPHHCHFYHTFILHQTQPSSMKRGEEEGVGLAAWWLKRQKTEFSGERVQAWELIHSTPCTHIHYLL